MPVDLTPRRAAALSYFTTKKRKDTKGTKVQD
jgi:hypothetical protein